MPEPKLTTATITIPYGSNLVIKITGENYGDGILDTRVEITEGTLCWITWKDKDEFIQELKAVIDKYAI